jgi:hypothetical protein
MPDSAIPFGAHSRPMPMRDQCQLAAARLRCEPRSHAVDGLARSDVTDRSPLHSGTKPGTRRYKARYKVRYKARYKVAQGGTKQHVHVCCQGVCGAEAKHPRGRSQTSRGGGPMWQVPQAVRTLEPARAEDAARGRSRPSAAVAGAASCTPNRGAHARHCQRVIRAPEK